MGKKICRNTIFFILLFPGLGAVHLVHAQDSLPMEIAGLRLGEDIATCNPTWLKGTAMPNSDAPFISEVDIQSSAFPGVRGGAVGYGTCKNPGKIIWIKLKFDDRQPELFEALLAAYKKELGDSPRWFGDAFQIVKSWQWSLTGSTGQRVEALLSYSKSSEFRPGTSVKLTLRSLFQQELQCYRERQKKLSAGSDRFVSFDALDIKRYIPR